MGLGFAYEGTNFDRVDEGDTVTHYITVDSSTDLEYTGSSVYMDLDRDKATDGTVTYTFSSVQNNPSVTYVDQDTVTVLVKLGTVRITSGTDVSKNVTVTAVNSADISAYAYVSATNILFSAADAGSSAAVSAYNVDATQSGIHADVYASLVYDASGITDANAGMIRLPALVVTVTATAAATS